MATFLLLHGGFGGLAVVPSDQWGGLLLTDATPGLALFPDELTLPVTFRAPGEIPALFRRLGQDGELRSQLQQGWRELIRREHTYARRLFQVLEAVDLAG